jgi:4'-phosphopantetheinyl transferase EntD
LIERLLPEFVACAEAAEDARGIELFPEEQTSIAHAVDKRRREFMTGRACARLALSRLGVPVAAIASGEHGEPLWPAGVVGSITHCAEYRACAVARAGAVVTLGIDAEPNRPLPQGVLEEVAYGRELEFLAGCSPPFLGGHEVDVARLLFSAKEAVYKAWFPLTRRWLGFEDVELSIDLANAAFRARLLVPAPVVDGTPLNEFPGRWALERGVICTAIVMTPRGG